MYVVGWQEIVHKKEKKMGVGWDSGEFSKTKKKAMKGVAERKQQRKKFGGRKESKIKCTSC